MKITTNLTKDSIADAIQQVRDYRQSLKPIAYKIAKMVADYGVEYAREAYETADYDGDKQIDVKIDERKNGYAVVADGEAVCFIEFGTGVYYNSTNTGYPLHRPEGLVDIGEYGLEHGRDESWKYVGNPGTMGQPLGNGAIKTHGNVAQYVLATTAELMEERIREFAKEVFLNEGR